MMKFPMTRRSLLGGLAIGAAYSWQSPDRAAWMRQARFGVMTHYLADWIARTNKLEMSVSQWNQLVDNFDVDGLAAQYSPAYLQASSHAATSSQICRRRFSQRASA